MAISVRGLSSPITPFILFGLDPSTFISTIASAAITVPVVTFAAVDIPGDATAPTINEAPRLVASIEHVASQKVLP